MMFIIALIWSFWIGFFSLTDLLEWYSLLYCLYIVWSRFFVLLRDRVKSSHFFSRRNAFLMVGGWFGLHFVCEKKVLHICSILLPHFYGYINIGKLKFYIWITWHVHDTNLYLNERHLSWLWEGIKIFPILNTAWKYAIVQNLIASKSVLSTTS